MSNMIVNDALSRVPEGQHVVDHSSCFIYLLGREIGIDNPPEDLTFRRLVDTEVVWERNIQRVQGSQDICNS